MAHRVMESNDRNVRLFCDECNHKWVHFVKVKKASLPYGGAEYHFEGRLHTHCAKCGSKDELILVRDEPQGRKSV